jgi:hypothetical protein
MGSPVFDYTPLRQVLESETVEATPVMEETQSQSVAGTQIVTQDYMVEEQLAKEKERQAAKLAQHQEKLTTYYRKYPAKAKSVKGNAVVNDVPPKVRKERVVCRKIKENSPLGKAAAAAAAQARDPLQQTYAPGATQEDVAADKVISFMFLFVYSVKFLFCSLLHRCTIVNFSIFLKKICCYCAGYKSCASQSSCCCYCPDHCFFETSFISWEITSGQP